VAGALTWWTSTFSHRSEKASSSRSWTVKKTKQTSQR